MRVIPLPLPAPPAPIPCTAPAAARLALERPLPRSTRARRRVENAATLGWCRTLQLPTVREIAEIAHLRSPSSVTQPFGRLVDVWASVIALEWNRIEEGWLRATPAERWRWWGAHAEVLFAADPALVRLPGLVCSAVVASGALTRLPPPSLLAPLHGLAAEAGTVHMGDLRLHDGDLRPPAARQTGQTGRSSVSA